MSAPASWNTDALRQALQAARRQHGAGAGAVLDILLRTPGLDRAALTEGLEGWSGVRALLHEAGHRPDFGVIDADTARRERVLAVRAPDGALLLAAEDPWNDELLQRLARQRGGSGAAATPVAVTQALLEGWLGGRGHGDSAPAAKALTGSPAEGPIVSFVESALRAGFAGGASDIHFECDRTGVVVKHRLDGVMVRFARLEGEVHAQEVISRIKVLAQLDITERRLPQDGRFRMPIDAQAVDLRVSIMPSIFGEDAVLRLLDKAQLRHKAQASQQMSLVTLGFEPDNCERIRDLAREPNGMLLVTGPTGSGKTTTVYAVLSEINDGNEKIITIEDPVEYELPGVLQIPVNERKGLTFAKGLRSILRHDPDRILVGEIRDAETAEIAVQSALTGHLVFTTVHANSVADIMGRFRHFGLDMFGFMSSLDGVIVQRLVRGLCPRCAGVREPDASERSWLARWGQGQAKSLPRAVGCGDCHGTGYRGRFVMAEVHVVDDGLRDHVTQGAPVTVLKQHVQARCTESLAQQAARHVVQGRTSIEEVRRVVGWL